MCISAIVHKHEDSQNAVANHAGAIAAIQLVLDQVYNCASRGAACCTLVEMTFRNAGNALLIATSPGMMRAVLAVLQSSEGDVRDDADELHGDGAEEQRPVERLAARPEPRGVADVSDCDNM